MPFDGKEFGKDIVAAVNASIERSIAPLMARLDALEAKAANRSDLEKRLDADIKRFDESMQRALDKIAIKALIVEECKDVRAGLEATIGSELQELVSVQIVEAVSKAVEAIPVPRDGEDGKSVTLDDVRPLIDEAVKAIPVPAAPELPDIAGMIDEAVSKAVEAIPAPKDGEDGKSVTVDDVRPLIDEAVSKAVEAIPAPKDGEDGKSVTVDDVRPLIDEAVSKAVEAIPAPKDGEDGKSVTVDDVRPLIDEAVSKAVEAIEIPELPEIVIPELPDIAGMVKEMTDAVEARISNATKTTFDAYRKDVFEAMPAAPELPDIVGMIDEAVSKAVEAIPAPKDGEDGKSVTVDDVRPLIDEAVSKAVALIPTPKDGRDGVDGVDAFIDKMGDLIFTFSNGKTKNVGRVVGDDGVDCDFHGVWKLIDEKLDTWPKPRDGVDGMGFDDLTMEYDGERTIKFVMVRGDQRKEFEFMVPVMLDRGVFVDGKSYDRGDSVTWAGQIWIAQIDKATKKPGENNTEWRLAVKRGSRGKDGALLAPRENKPVKIGV